ncbi:MFS transporter [Paenibacillus sp. 32352]|uniref:MFS transporter n=1 Tax=Paenibacillus sp. 32352 TaxID=1969111 RepID=UPI0009AD5EC0|nr:MFS transporter [Paenibacillus sp. 32352]
MSKQHNGLILLAMALGLLMSSLDNTITSAAVSHIIKDIGGFESMSWVFSAYMLAATSTMLVFGKMSDLFGRKRFYLIGIGFFLIGSALCGISQNITQLIWFRALQGIGSGALMPISFTIIYTLFADPKQAAKLSGVFAAIFGLSSVAGPQIGTLLSEAWGWRWCFYVNVPLGALSFLTLLFALKESRSERRPKIDYLGTLLLILSTVSLMLALEWGGKDGSWTSWPTLSLLAVAIVGGIFFVRTELRAEEPVLPLKLFRNRMITGTSIACICQGAIMFSAITYLPMFSVAVLGQPNSNGLLTPMMFSLIVGSIVFASFQTVVSFRSLIVTSMLFGIVAAYLLMNVPSNASNGYMILLMILLGFGAIGPLMSIAQSAVAFSVDKQYIGISSSIVGFWRNIGGVLGATMMAAIVNSHLSHQIQDGASTHQIPADKLDTLANPELLMRAGASVPQEIKDFLRESLAASINHGFILALCLAALGIIAGFYVGPGKMVKPKAAPPEAVKSA